MTLSRDMIVLGLETSCDETAAAIVRRRADGTGELLANQILSQMDHAAYGGVVPELAARAHVTHLDALITAALSEAKLDFTDLDGIAATAGPGLIGGVLVGLMTAKGLAFAHGLPLIGVNHLEGHALTARLTDEAPFPYLLLLVSGGHCQLLIVEGVGRYERLGATIDDAVGEAFDKTAKMMGLGYPGGPAVEKAAASGNADRFALPRPLTGREGCDFSFSGLKTAVRKALLDLEEVGPQDKADLAASFQKAVGDILARQTGKALEMAGARLGPAPRLVVAGGVAANRYLRTRLEALCQERGAQLIVPPPKLCTDNGAMIAWAGAERLALGLSDPLDLAARARWPLTDLAAS
ncbi:metalloendopeptidase glycoprotease family [Tepidicaulis marinus]|uniref:tRNA N6-adenosine threonylcarbamoyltransferase n=2 Tax=Tepidicaulis marinus TaxID=1333998 RepID=A0A081B6B5_9HYPH|nr:metalloendopeptidase glycoprotease family [Tepidicaulis marinus]